MFIIAKDHVLLLYNIIQMYYASTKQSIKCESIINFLKSKEIKAFLIDDKLSFDVIVDIAPQKAIPKNEILKVLDKALI